MNTDQRGPETAVVRAIGAAFIFAGLAKLKSKRNPPSLVPDWLDPLRPEITAGTGVLFMTNGILLLLPTLGRVGRIMTLALLALASPAAIYEARHPLRIRFIDRMHGPGPVEVVVAGRPIGYALVILAVWWATRRTARSRPAERPSASDY
jgi:uncharacterized membrane protein